MKRAVCPPALLFWSAVAFGKTNVPTYHYDNYRTGQNPRETILLPANVGTHDKFARLFTIGSHSDLIVVRFNGDFL